MHKRDYELIAGRIRQNLRTSESIGDSVRGFAESLIQDLCRDFYLDNDRFSAPRFLAACRGEDSTDSAGRKVRYSSSVDSSSIRAPKTGQPCGCRRGIERDNCPACEGTGQRIDFRAIHAARVSK